MALAVMLTGCYEDFNPDIDTKPVLAINSLITAGEPIEVEVTHTWLYSEGWAENVDYSVSDAEVAIYVDGVRVSEDYIPREGENIRIVAESKTYGKAEAEVSVPYAVKDAHADYFASIVSDWHDNTPPEMNSEVRFDVSINLILRDLSDRMDYYRLHYSSFLGAESGDFDIDGAYIDYPAYFHQGSFDENSEPIFSEHIGVFESVMGSEAYGATFFTDRQFSGSEYTLHLRFTNADFRVKNSVYDEDLLNCGYILELQSISPSYYNWLNYEWQIKSGVTGDIIDFGFGDPIWGYSNVSTGAGVVAARSISTLKVNLKDFLQTIIRPS